MYYVELVFELDDLAKGSVRVFEGLQGFPYLIVQKQLQAKNFYGKLFLKLVKSWFVANSNLIRSGHENDQRQVDNIKLANQKILRDNSRHDDIGPKKAADIRSKLAGNKPEYLGTGYVTLNREKKCPYIQNCN